MPTTPTARISRLYLDMLDQPHTLIAGVTGSGKSTVITSLLTAALFDAPTARRLILIDPKRVELGEFADAPHTLAHVAGYKPDQWRQTLRAACDMMDARYTDMERRHLRTYDGSHVYIVIDEFAALIKSETGKDCYRLLLRLTSEGRASRVHCVIATQVPKAEIIPTEVRENMTARLCLRCNTRTQSRVLMDQNGCETLPQFGYGYYITPRATTLYRIDPIDDAARAEIIEYWTRPRARA